METLFLISFFGSTLYFLIAANRNAARARARKLQSWWEH